MKKFVLFFTAVVISGALLAQDTITGWKFPANNGPDSLNANMGTSQNQGYDIRFQWVIPNDTTVNTVFFTNGVTSYAAATAGWVDAANNKYWSIKFKAPGYGDFKVSSAQKSQYEGYTEGPGEFKLQWKLSSGDYADIPNGTVQVSNDWGIGTITNLPVPITGQGTSSVYIRWIATTNLDFHGNPVTPTGISMIDDILVTGTASSGTNDVIFTNRVNIYPVPNKGNFTFESKVPVTSLVVTDISGKEIYNNANPGLKSRINLGNISKGTYILKVGFIDTDKPCSIKFLVD